MNNEKLYPEELFAAARQLLIGTQIAKWQRNELHESVKGFYGATYKFSECRSELDQAEVLLEKALKSLKTAVANAQRSHQ